MTITAKIIADSINTQGTRLTTMQVRYPRFVHAEAKTHRVIRIDDAEIEFMREIGFMDDEDLSRNASSSRAIPIERMIKDVIDDPAMPVSWGSNKPGMQAGDELSPTEKAAAKARWMEACNDAVHHAMILMEMGCHKQIVNRILEPFGHISVVVSATEWDNFYKLRCHPAADPTMRALAEAMRTAHFDSKPKKLLRGEWHLPYISEKEIFTLKTQDLAMISAARCARVSYLNHDGSNPDIQKDLALSKMLAEMEHLSPFEHQALSTPLVASSGNFGKGWLQFRQDLSIQN
jgi:thymidylate synthase ThyX